jgi:ribosomal protein S8
MNIINTPTKNRIAKEFFLDFMNTTEVSKKLYPNAFNSLKSRLPRKKNVGIVAGFFSQLRKEGYIEDKTVLQKRTSCTGKKFESLTIVYRLNLNPFFEYVEKKINLPLDEKERKFLEYVFEIKDCRKIVYNYNDLFEGICNFLEKISFYEQLGGETLIVELTKGFFTENKKYLKKYENPSEQYEEFWDVAIKFLDNFVNKIKLLSPFKQEDYLSLEYNPKVGKYTSIPHVIPDYESEENKKKSLKRFEIVFYEKREPTNDEMLETRGNL